jgi:hypothetical protein
MVKSFLHNSVGATAPIIDDISNTMTAGGTYWVDDPISSMTCAVVQANSDRLDSVLDYWYTMLQTGGFSTVVYGNAVNQVLSYLGVKRAGYDGLMEKCATQTSTNPTTTNPGTPATTNNPDLPAPQNSNSIMTWITANPVLSAAIAAAVIIGFTYFTKPKRKQTRRRRNINRSYK